MLLPECSPIMRGKSSNSGQQVRDMAAMSPRKSRGGRLPQTRETVGRVLYVAMDFLGEQLLYPPLENPQAQEKDNHMSWKAIPVNVSVW